MENWKWKNFDEEEMGCRGKTCGCNHELWDKEREYKPHELDDNGVPLHFIKSMDALQALRDKWGKPIIINSAHRCKKHNDRIEGAPKSKHLDIAFDCAMAKVEHKEFAKLARSFGFNGIGSNYNSFVHIDIRDVDGNW